MSPGVECLTLDRESFKQLIGDLEELHEKDYGDSDRIYAIRQIENRHIRVVEHEREIERGNRRPSLWCEREIFQCLSSKVSNV